MIRLALVWVIAATAARAQQPVQGAGGTAHDDSRARAVESLVRFAPSAYPELPPSIRIELERRGCLIPQGYARSSDTTAEARKAELTRRANVIHGQFFERGKFEWGVLCSSHGTTSIIFIPDDAQRRPVLTAKMAKLSTAPDSTWINHDRNGGWIVQPGIFLAKASTINRAKDGAKLDRAEKTRPVHDGLAIDDTVDGSGYTIYWTGRRWVQVQSYD